MEKWSLAFPSESWSSSIEYFWYGEVSESGYFEVIPDGRLDFGIVLSKRNPRFVLFGVATKPRLLPLEPGVFYAGARFCPGVALHDELGGVSELRDSERFFDRLCGIEAREVVARFANIDQVEPVETALSDLLGFVLLPSDTRSLYVRRACVQIAQSEGVLRIEELATNLAVSRRYLEKAFQEMLGLSPKTFSKITRLGALAKRIGVDSMEWAELAAELNFSDQAHMNRDVSRMTGYTPKAFQERVRKMPDGWAGTLRK